MLLKTYLRILNFSEELNQRLMKSIERLPRVAVGDMVCGRHTYDACVVDEVEADAIAVRRHPARFY